MHYVMVSVGVSRMGKTGVIFIELGAKVNSSYYCERVLGEGLLPDIRAKCRRYRWTLQQDGALPHTAKNTLWLYGSRVDTMNTQLYESVVANVEIVQTL